MPGELYFRLDFFALEGTLKNQIYITKEQQIHKNLVLVIGSNEYESLFELNFGNPYFGSETLISNTTVEINLMNKLIKNIRIHEKRIKIENSEIDGHKREIHFSSNNRSAIDLIHESSHLGDNRYSFKLTKNKMNFYFVYSVIQNELPPNDINSESLSWLP